MIKHIVMWTIGESNGKPKLENIALIKDLLISLKEKISQIKQLEVGENLAKAPQNNYDLVLSTSFENFEDLEKYIEHPSHKEVAQVIKSLYLSRACVDYEI